MKAGAEKYRWAGAAAVAGGLGLCLAVRLAPRGSFFSPMWPWVLLLLPALFLAEWCHRRARWRGQWMSVPADLYPVLALLAAMMLFLLSRATCSPTFYFLRWNGISGASPYKAWLVRTMLYTLLLTPVAMWGAARRRMWLLALAVLFAVQYDCVRQFLEATGGLPLYRDDHPSFMYRLWVFGRIFPRLVYYDPFWNGGVVATYLISSGITAIGMLLWPIWHWLPVEMTYTPVLAFLFILVVPWVSVAAVRAAGGTWAGAFAAGAMAVLVNRLYLLWLLHFGTVGCAFSLAFSGLVAALTFRIAVLGDTRWRTVTALALAGYCYVVWPPAGFFALGLVPAFLSTVRHWQRRSLLALSVSGVLVLLLFSPNIAGILSHVHLGHYVSGQRQIEWAEQLQKGWHRLLEYCRRGHPLLVFPGILGAWFLADRTQRRYWGLAVVGLVVLTGWGGIWRPRLEFSRAGIALFFLACVPAGLWAGRILEQRSLRLGVVQALLLVLLAAAGLNAADLYENRGIEHYKVMPEEVRRFAAWIRRNVPEGARVLFAGPTVHGYGGGHVAWLPVMSGREMMACDYYHFSPKSVEYEYPPRGYRSFTNMVRFLRAYNVSHITTFRKYWQRRLESHPDTFELVYQFGRMRRPKKVYRVKQDLSPFLQGAGRVCAALNELVVFPEDPQGDLVIKYNWVEGLHCDPPARISPYAVDERIRLIRVCPNGLREVRIWFDP